jgi:uncharacterized membrane protein
MLNKSRLENLSDGLYAIVLTLLVFDIKLPADLIVHTNVSLVTALYDLLPVFLGFIVSFFVLMMFWISHNFFYHYFAKTINRQLVLLNLMYLGLISLIPFSAHLLGQHPDLSLAVAIYGINVFCIGVLNIIIFRYALNSHEIESADVPPRLFFQAKIRSYVTPVCTAIGIGLAFVSIPAAIGFYAFPILFNIIPGTLDAVERLFGFELGA